MQWQLKRIQQQRSGLQGQSHSPQAYDNGPMIQVI